MNGHKNNRNQKAGWSVMKAGLISKLLIRHMHCRMKNMYLPHGGITGMHISMDDLFLLRLLFNHAGNTLHFFISSPSSPDLGWAYPFIFLKVQEHMYEL